MSCRLPIHVLSVHVSLSLSLSVFLFSLRWLLELVHVPLLCMAHSSFSCSFMKCANRRIWICMEQISFDFDIWTTFFFGPHSSRACVTLIRKICFSQNYLIRIIFHQIICLILFGIIGKFASVAINMTISSLIWVQVELHF